MPKSVVAYGVLTIGALLLVPVSVYADTIQIFSDQSHPNQSNDSLTRGVLGGSNVNINIVGHYNWAAPLPGSSWISFNVTGNPFDPNFLVLPNGTVVSFFDQFFLPGTPLSGSILVMADDSTSVWLNNTLLLPEGSTTANTYRNCSDFAPGCLPQTTAMVDLTPYLIMGVNTLRFDVAQRSGHAFGLNYAGTVEWQRVPEPGSLALLATGLIIAGGYLARRKFS